MKAQKKNGYSANSQKKNCVFCTELSHEVDLWYDENNMAHVTELIKKTSVFFLYAKAKNGLIQPFYCLINNLTKYNLHNNSYYLRVAIFPIKQNETVFQHPSFFNEQVFFSRHCLCCLGVIF